LQAKLFLLPEDWVGPFAVSVIALSKDGEESDPVSTLATAKIITELFALYDGNQVEIRWQAIPEAEVKVVIGEEEFPFGQISAQSGDEIMITSTFNDVSGIPITMVIGDNPQAFWQLSEGWHLISSPLEDNKILAAFQKDIVESIWKWTNNKWAVHLPGQDTEAYTSAKGFDVLSSLDANQGFWLNLKEAVSFKAEGQFALFQESPDSGWSLIGNDSDISINQLGEFTSIWKWVNNKWAVHLPGQDTEAYTLAKGFDVLEEVYSGEGFWVNK